MYIYIYIYIYVLGIHIYIYIYIYIMQQNRIYALGGGVCVCALSGFRLTYTIRGHEDSEKDLRLVIVTLQPDHKV